MPQFLYKAKSGPKDVTSGIIEADTITDAVTKLTNAGKIPIDIKLYVKITLSANKEGKDSDSTISQAALFQFTRQLADLLEAGIPLARCMEILSHQHQFPLMVKIIESMTGVLQKGGILSLPLANTQRYSRPCISIP